MSEPNSVAKDLTNAGRGLLMGAADIIPGVSGGTVALLLGIYPRLLTAISHVDGDLFRLVLQRQWGEAAKHLDLRFLMTLAAGILSGILILAGVIHVLLHDYREPTLAAFFGLILASGILVARMAKPATKDHAIGCLLLGVVAAGFAAWLVSGSYLEPNDSLLYVFICGAIAICAMILPGISGAYILVLLGEYEAITDLLHRLKAGDVGPSDLATLAVFMLGCVVGLLAFSKVLKWLLARFYNETMAVLGGFMIGSLLKIWPFQESKIAGEEITKTTITHPVWPAELNGQVLLCVGVAAVAFVFVIVADQLAHRTGSKEGNQG